MSRDGDRSIRGSTMRFDKSRELYQRSKQSLAGGVSSHHRAGEKPVPLFFERGKGSRLYDVDGNEFIDYFMGNGPAIFGHAPDFLLDAVRGSLDRGQMFAGQHDLEFRVAELVKETVPCVDLVRYSSSGTEAVLTAVRLARAHTGRNRIIKFEGHYHGWGDPVLYSVGPSLEDMGPYESPTPVPESAGQSRGSSQEVIVLPWNDLDVLTRAVERHQEDIAAIIMEPVPVNTNGAFPKPGYLEGVRELCDDNGIVLIFDEVITGYRLALGGAQEYLGVTPDVVTLAKAVAGGFPLSIVAGKQRIMDSIADGSVMHAGTASGNITSLVAAEATINKLKENGGEAIKYLHYIGSRLVDGLKRLGQKHEEDILIQGPAPIFSMAFTREVALPDYRSFKEHADHERYARFRQELLERGVRTNDHGKWFLSTAHTEEDIDQTLDAADGAFRAL